MGNVSTLLCLARSSDQATPSSIDNVTTLTADGSRFVSLVLSAFDSCRSKFARARRSFCSALNAFSTGPAMHAEVQNLQQSCQQPQLSFRVVAQLVSQLIEQRWQQALHQPVEDPSAEQELEQGQRDAVMYASGWALRALLRHEERRHQRREGVIEALRLLSTDAAGAPDSLDAILTRVNISQCAAASECQIAQYILVALLLHCALNRLPSLIQHGWHFAVPSSMPLL